MPARTWRVAEPSSLMALVRQDSRMGQRWQIANADPLAYNDPGKPPRVAIEEEKVGGGAARIWVAPCSVTLYALRAEPSRER